jgi:hypothetical protein
MQRVLAMLGVLSTWVRAVCVATQAPVVASLWIVT